MIRTQIYIPEKIHQQAKFLARQQKEPMAKLLRRLIMNGLQLEKSKQETQRLSQLSKLNITGGPKNLSQNLDSYLYESN